MHVLVRYCDPVPHVLEHLCHLPHGLQRPFTARKYNICEAYIRGYDIVHLVQRRRRNLRKANWGPSPGFVTAECRSNISNHRSCRSGNFAETELQLLLLDSYGQPT